LLDESQRADGEPADGDLPVCAQPLSGLAEAGLDRGAHHNLLRPRPKYPGEDARRNEENVMNASTPLATAVTARPPLDAAALKERVAIHDLGFFYGEAKALKGITLSLYENRVTAFIGPSGCGKSTLLRVLNRMYDLYPNQRATGEVMFDGMNIVAPGQDVNLLRARIGMVFQKPTPLPMSI